MEKLLPYIAALLILAIANLAVNLLLATGHLFSKKTQPAQVIKTSYAPAQQEQAP
jgi:hypothetical protein